MKHVFICLIALVMGACHSDPVRPQEPEEPQKPAKSLKQLRLDYADTDFQEVEYDTAGLPQHYVSQYLYIQGTGEVKRLEFTFKYGPDKRLYRLNGSDGSYTQYMYEGGLVAHAERYDQAGKPRSLVTLRYNTANQLTEMEEAFYADHRNVRSEYQYDANGNLSQLKLTERTGETAPWQPTFTFFYSGYDDKKNPENLWACDPLIPQIKLRQNNPGLEVVHDRVGETSRKQHTYTYSAEGYPLTRTTTAPGGTLTTRYNYVKH